MKKVKNAGLLVLVLFALDLKLCMAQEKAVWSAKFSKAINWYWLTPAGIFLVGTNEALYGIDPNKNGVAWALKDEDYAGIEVEKVNRYGKTPYIMITREPPSGKNESSSGSLKLGNMISKSFLNWMVLLDPVNGDIVFDTRAKDIGFDNIEKKSYLSTINCLLLEGTKDKVRCFGIYDLNTRKTRFVVEKPVKLKGFTLRDNLDFYIQPNGELIIKYVNNTYMIDVATGEKKWSRMNDSLYQFVFDYAGNSMYASGGKFIAKLDGQSGNITTLVTPPDMDEKEKSQEAYFSNLFLAGIKLLPLEDKLMATYKGGINFFDYNTLQPKWNKVLKISGFSVINIKAVQDNNTLLFLRNTSNDQTSLMLINSDGKLLWDKPYTVAGTIIKMLETADKGILCVTDVQADIVSWQNGKSKLQSVLKFKTDEYVMVAHAKSQNAIGFFNNGKVYEINYETNTIRKMIDKTNFKGPDDEDKRPTWFEARPDGYFLSASQNIMLIGYDGNIKFNNYYSRPGLSDRAKRMLAFGGGLVLGYVFNEEAQKLTNEMYTSGLMSGEDFITIKALDTKSGTGSALIAGGLSSIAFAQQSARQKIGQSNRTYQLILAKMDDGGTGFLKIDKDSGTKLSSLDFDDKNPTIKIDDAIAGLYYIDDKEVFFYSMQ